MADVMTLLAGDVIGVNFSTMNLKNDRIRRKNKQTKIRKKKKKKNGGAEFARFQLQIEV